jgi:hypothetical protein
MQVAAVHSTESNGFTSYRNPARSFIELSARESQRDLAQRYTNLLSAGLARAPLYERNWMLSSLFQEGPDMASGQIAESVVNWLNTGRVVRSPVGNLSRYQLSEKRGANWVYETYTQNTLRRDAWRRYPELKPILVEGSPDAPYAKTVRNLSAVRRTHHFVMLRVAGRMYVIDGARGMVFDSLGAYLDTVMLPGVWGEDSVRMKWFRIFDGGRENQGGIVAQDDWSTSA